MFSQANKRHSDDEEEEATDYPPTYPPLTQPSYSDIEEEEEEKAKEEEEKEKAEAKGEYKTTEEVIMDDKEEGTAAERRDDNRKIAAVVSPGMSVKSRAHSVHWKPSAGTLNKRYIGVGKTAHKRNQRSQFAALHIVRGEKGSFHRAEEVKSSEPEVRNVSFDEALLEGFVCKRVVMVRFNPNAVAGSDVRASEFARFVRAEQLLSVPGYKVGAGKEQMFVLSADMRVKRIEFENDGQIEQLKYGIVGVFSDGSIFWLKE